MNLKNSSVDEKYSYKVARERKETAASNRFKTLMYIVGSRLCSNKMLFTNVYAKSQDSKKLEAKRFGPCAVKELIGKSAAWLGLSNHFRIHPVIHACHTRPYTDQLQDISFLVLPPLAPV